MSSRILQIIPAQPGWRAMFTVGDELIEVPITVWALIERSDRHDIPFQEVVPLILDESGMHQALHEVLADVRKYMGFLTPGQAAPSPKPLVQNSGVTLGTRFPASRAVTR